MFDFGARKQMRNFSITVLAAALAALIIALAPFGFARAQSPLDRMTVVAIDRSSISGDEEALGLARSALGLLIHLKSGRPFAFVFTDDLSNPMGPTDTDALAFRDMRDDVYKGLESPPMSDDPLDVAGSLAEIYNFMSGLNAGSNASVYLLTGSAAPRDFDDEMADVDPVLALIDASGWSVFNITTPSIAPGLASELDEIALDTGGRSFALTSLEGFEALADDTLRREGKGLINELGDTVLSGSVFAFEANVVPGTERLDLLFFREESLTSFRLTNPSGVESSVGDRTSSSVDELPNAVIWEIVDPAPGAWRMEARGASGRLTGSMFTINRYRIQLWESNTVPVGQPHTLVAAALDGGALKPLPDASVTARVTTPSGAAILYELVDTGQGGDAAAGDGFYSTTLPPVDAAGAYTVELNLSWEGIDYAITSLSSFQAQEFPAISVETEETGIIKIRPGARTKIATVWATVADIPFPLSANDLNATVTTDPDVPPGEIELAPRRLISGDKALEFEVFYTPAVETRATVTINLQMLYGGRPHTPTMDHPPIVVSSVSPRPTAVPPTPAPTVAPAATTVPLPTPTPAPPDTRPQTAALIIAAALALAIVGSLIYWVSRPTPFGFIYTEDGHQAADFRALQRGAGSNLFSRSAVTGEELDIPDFAGVTFEFRGRGEIAISVSAESSHDVRLNNQPVTESTQVFDNSLIGILGRLYIFRTERQEEPEDDAEDDEA